MSKIKIDNYKFDKTAKTITFTDYGSIRLDAVLLITNTTSNVIIYNFADPTKGGTVVNNVLTLAFDTASMSNSDSLMIYYDDTKKVAGVSDIFGDQSLLTGGELTVRISDDPLYGDSGPLQQHEKETPSYAARELLTFDTNLHTIFGSQNLLTSAGRLKVAYEPDIDKLVFGVMAALNQEVIMPLQGMGTISVQLIGTWAGTISFFGSNDGQGWLAIGGNPLSAGAFVTTTTANGLWRMGAMGLKYFKCAFTSYTSGKCQALITSSPITLGVGAIPAAVTMSGSVGTASQKASTSELNTFDTNMNPSNAAIKDAFQYPDPWNPIQANYYIGDTCTFNGQVYQCILAHSALVAGQTPLNTTYWVVDKRQNKSLITKFYSSQPDAARVRVEIDLDGYQYRLMESQLLNQQQQLQNDMIFDDYNLTLLQSGIGGQLGKQFAMGQSAMSTYNFTEIR
jgi:hypothetical protein